MRYNRTSNGRLELDISDDSSWTEFERLARHISAAFEGRIEAKIDGLDQRYWDIEIEGEVVTLHLEHYLGICLFAAKAEGDEVVRRVGEFLGLLFSETNQVISGPDEKN